MTKFNTQVKIKKKYRILKNKIVILLNFPPLIQISISGALFKKKT